CCLLLSLCVRATPPHSNSSLLFLLFFFSSTRPPPTSTLFPYPTLSRSRGAQEGQDQRPGARRIECGETRGDALPHAVLREQLARSEEHTSELQSLTNLVCRLLLEKKKKT